ncbi:hypothetical protein LTR53_009067 [Teratosphaeriaceae sp. CCFEE 6253]|nr:hypothetical protein LTR53_009067 [Teratosphaeriaceae sp. CCFEE 6253]
MSHSLRDSVSVFHFTNKISSAKIRKYKIATERGMGDGDYVRDPSLGTPAPGSYVTRSTPREPDSASPGADGSTEPASKRPRLKLNVGPRANGEGSPSNFGVDDTGRVSKRDPTRLRMRYDENMELEDESLRIHSPTESELSSVDDSIPPPPPQPQYPPASPAPPGPKPHPEYGMLQSYYIEGGDEEDEQAKAPPVQPPPQPATQPPPRKPQVRRKRLTAAQQRQMQQQQQQQYQMQLASPYQNPFPPTDPRHVPAQMQIQRQFQADEMRRQQYYQMQQQQQQHPQQHPQQAHQPPPLRSQQPPPPPPPPELDPAPKVELTGFDFIGIIRPSRTLQTVQQMVDNLAELSNALTNFGGLPAASSSPIAQHNATHEKSVKVLDNFLGLFEDGDSEAEQRLQAARRPPPPDLDFPLTGPSQPDGPLTYGIQFIQNALKSWAQQAHLRPASKRALGRPRKFEGPVPVPVGAVGDPQQQPPRPKTVLVKAEHTPEGVAIRAFQHVLESGCLRVNGFLPQELTRALRMLYVQIDHLINQQGRAEPAWRPLSYGPQIAAHRMQVDRRVEEQRRVEEMERERGMGMQQGPPQHGLSQGPPPPHGPLQHGPPAHGPPPHGPPQGPHQMGMPPTGMLSQPHYPGPPNHGMNAAQHAQMLAVERKRHEREAFPPPPFPPRQPSNPLLLGSQPTGTPQGYAPSTPPTYAAHSIPHNHGNTPALRPNGSASAPPTPVEGKRKRASTMTAQSPRIDPQGEQLKMQLERITMYQPGAMQRAGPQTKFAFAPAAMSPQGWRPAAFLQGGESAANNDGAMRSGQVPSQGQGQGQDGHLVSRTQAVGGVERVAAVPSIESSAGQPGVTSIATQLSNSTSTNTNGHGISAVDADGDTQMTEDNITVNHIKDNSTALSMKAESVSTASGTPAAAQVHTVGFTAVNGKQRMTLKLKSPSTRVKPGAAGQMERDSRPGAADAEK